MIMELPRESSNYPFNEKVMIAKIYRYFLNPASFNLPHTKLQPRKLVSLILGVGEATIGRIMSDVNSNNGRNFNADIFEFLFRKLCCTIEEKYGPSIIHMDGVRYHKRRIGAVLSSSSHKQVMQTWLISKDVAFGDQETKAMLYEKIKANRPKVSYACVEIAREYGHALQYTPPYHCEIQPIEGVWGVAKNQVGPKQGLTILQSLTFACL
jgi:hypothetical protein